MTANCCARQVIDSRYMFLARTIRFQQLMLAALDRQGLPGIDVAQSETPDDITPEVIAAIRGGTSPLID